MQLQARSGEDQEVSTVSGCLLPAGISPVQGTEPACNNQERVPEVRRLVTLYPKPTTG